MSRRGRKVMKLRPAVEIGWLELLGIAIDESYRPVPGHQGRHGHQAEERRGASRASDLARRLEVPKRVLIETRKDHQNIGTRHGRSPWTGKASASSIKRYL